MNPKDKVPINLKRRSYNSCFLSVFTYGLETITIHQKTVDQLRVARRPMGRIFLGVTSRDKMRNSHIQDRTKVLDVVKRVASLKCQWIGHVLRQEQYRWTPKVILRRPKSTTRSVDRLKKRWIDDVRTVGGGQCMRLARHRTNLEDASILQWMDTDWRRKILFLCKRIRSADYAVKDAWLWFKSCLDHCLAEALMKSFIKNDFESSYAKFFQKKKVCWA